MKQNPTSKEKNIKYSNLKFVRYIYRCEINKKLSTFVVQKYNIDSS